MKSFIGLAKLLFILFLLLVFNGCSNVQKSDETSKIQSLWPAPPDEPRYRYITTLFSSADIELKDDSESFRELITGRAKPTYEFRRPLDIAAYHGKLYVLDPSMSMIHVYDLPRRKYFQFGYRFEGKLAKPVGIHVNNNGNVYVTDRGRNAIIVYDSIGLYRKHIPLTGIATEIAGITTDATGSFIYAVDRGGVDANTHQVLKIDNNGNLIKRFGQRGKSEMEFNLPVDIAFGTDNNLYVLDAGNFRVQVMDIDGNYIKSWGGVGTSLGKFGMPRSITSDEENNIYVSDSQFGNIQIFSSNGSLLMHIGSLSNKDGPGRYKLITGITFDRHGYLYALDQYEKKLDVYKKLTVQERQEFQ